MKRFLVPLIAATVLGLSPGPRPGPIAAFRWTSHGPVAHITSVVADPHAPGTVYASAFPPSVFVSADDGATWTDVSNHLLLDPIHVHLSPDPSRAGVYAWRGYCYGSICYCCFGEIRRIFDGGGSFADPPSLPGAVLAFAADPADPSVLYGVFSEYLTAPFSGADILTMKSQNGGVSWEPMSGLEFSSVILPDPALSSRVYAAGPGTGFFVSHDAGDHWAASNQGLSDLDVRSLAVAQTGDVLYAGTASGIFRSGDGGASWARTNLARVAQALVVDPRSPDTVFAGTAEGVFHSSDGGESWGPMNRGLLGLAVRALAIDASGAFLHAGTDAGVFDMPLHPTPRIPPQR